MQLSKELTTVTPFSKAIGLTLFIVLPIITFSLGMSYQSTLQSSKNNVPVINPTEEPVACTMDARVCPDGTAVGRIPPNCEFEECPIVQDEVKTFTGVISNINYGCEVDGVCSIGVGKGNVIVLKGEGPDASEPRGTIPEGILDSSKLNNFLRKQVEVHAKTDGGRTDSYTIYGSKSFYIKLIDSAKMTCGGIAGKVCPSGYYCKYDGTYPDAAGTCLKTVPTTTKYVCPESEYVDCMPSIGIKKAECSPAFLQWATENCPGFQGAAY